MLTLLRTWVKEPAATALASIFVLGVLAIVGFAAFVPQPTPPLSEQIARELTPIPALAETDFFYVATAGPLKGKAASAEQVLNSTHAELQAQGVDAGYYVEKHCDYYSDTGHYLDWRMEHSVTACSLGRVTRDYVVEALANPPLKA